MTTLRTIALTATLAGLALLHTACTTSALGRSQLKLLPDAQVDQMGVTAFSEIRQKTPASRNAAQNRYVTCVANAVTAVAGGQWEVVVFEDETPNAFALPGGKIGVHTGLLAVAKTPDQLAAVIGHEIAHVQAGHSNERVSAALLAQSGLQAMQALGDPANPAHGEMLGLLGAGVQYGAILPYGRSHESEADLLGLDTMARAGFDPRESVVLWQNMAAATGPGPSEFMSTHPAPSTRIRDLQQRIPHAQELARQSGARRPNCGTPAR